jgi:hypothetical protein
MTSSDFRLRRFEASEIDAMAKNESGIDPDGVQCVDKVRVSQRDARCVRKFNE